MTNKMTNPAIRWSLLAFGAMTRLIGSAMIIVSSILGQRHRERSTGDPYESGTCRFSMSSA